MDASTERQREITRTLPMLQRLAFSYCPQAARGPTLGLLALDTRLASILRASREPMLAQLRLAWWREALAQPAGREPAGEPVLAALHGWDSQREALAGLASGWEAMTAPAPFPGEAIERLALARGRAFAGLAHVLGLVPFAGSAERMGGDWALMDLAARLTHPDERGAARALAAVRGWDRARLPRALRPLAVLHALSVRAMRRGEDLDAPSPRAFATAARAGLLGF